MFLVLGQILAAIFDGYLITSDVIYFRRGIRWIRITRNKIETVKFRSVRHVIIRYAGGMRVVVNLFGLNNTAYDKVNAALLQGLKKIGKSTYTSIGRDASVSN